MEFPLSLTDDDLLFLAEMFGIAHCGAVAERAFRHSNTLPEAVCAEFFANEVQNLHEEFLKKVLREPLRSPGFRKKFGEHFAAHPSTKIRLLAWPWLESVLVWEG